MLNEGDISEDQWKLCMNGAIAFLRQSLKYVIQHMDMHERYSIGACNMD